MEKKSSTELAWSERRIIPALHNTLQGCYNTLGVREEGICCTGGIEDLGDTMGGEADIGEARRQKTGWERTHALLI